MHSHDPRAFRLLSLRGALKLEAVGMKRSRGPSALAIVRKETGLKARTARDMLPRYEQWLRTEGYLRN